MKKNCMFVTATKISFKDLGGIMTLAKENYGNEGIIDCDLAGVTNSVIVIGRESDLNKLRENYLW
jgi:hypothetical protein